MTVWDGVLLVWTKLRDAERMHWIIQSLVNFWRTGFHMRGMLAKAASYMENIDIGVIMAHSLLTLTNLRSLASQ